MPFSARLRHLAKRVRDESSIVQVPVRHLAQIGHLVVTRGRDGGVTSQRGDLIRQLSDVDVISFDLFDTLVQRRCLLPEDVHQVVALGAEFGGSLDREAWPDIRERGELNARAESDEPDVTLDAIFAQFRALLDPVLLSRLKELEQFTEIAVARPTARGKQLWRAVRNAGKPIVVTTDTYLPKQTIVEILEKCGYSGWEAIYASGDDRIAKVDGSSFRRILGDHPGARILHIGDNKASDVKAARGTGISATQLTRPFDSRIEVRSGLPPQVDPRPQRRPYRLSRRTKLGFSLNAALIEDWLDQNDGTLDVIDEIGYAVLGPMLVGFSQYLGREVRRNGTQKLLFLAREGLILRRAYALCHGESAIENEYAVISTRILGLAGLTNPVSAESLHFLTRTAAPLRAIDFVSRILPDVREEAILAACRRAGVPWDARFTAREAQSVMRAVFGDFASELAAVGEESHPTVVAYLEALGSSDRDTAIVDVGWAGGIQSAMNRLTQSTHTGYYLALCDSVTTRAVPRLFAWIDQRHGGQVARDFRRMYTRTRVAALEMLLANVNSGSASSVRRAATDGTDGAAFVIDYLPNEFNEGDRSKIQRLQGRALDFVRDYAEAAGQLPFELRDLSRDAAFGPVFRFLTSPSIVQLRALHRIHSDGSYGVRANELGQWWVPVPLHLAHFRPAKWFNRSI